MPALFGASGVVGGAERYALELARHMAEVQPTRLVTFGEEAREERAGALEIRVLGRPWQVRGQRHNPMSRKLFRELAWANVVHCHQQHVLASSLAALYCRLTRRKVFVSDLGGGGWDVSGYFSTDRWYHGHLHISEYSRKAFGHAGNPRAHVILGGVDTVKFAPSAESANRRHVLYVGRLLPHKGIDDLIKAVPPDLPLVVLGRPYDERYRRDLGELAQGKQVEFRESSDDADLLRAYHEALCIVLHSVYRGMYGDETKIPELLGQTLLEGMACGLPAVCTDVASMPEVVVDGVTGFIVPPNQPAALGEKLAWLRGHPEEARRMGSAARQRVLEQFTWPLVVERCLTIYSVGVPGKA